MMVLNETRTRLNPTDRKLQILEAASLLSKKIGYSHITRKLIAETANLSEGLINHYYKRMAWLKDEVLLQAVKREDLDILAQGLALQDPIVLNLSDKLKRKISKYLSK